MPGANQSFSRSLLVLSSLLPLASATADMIDDSDMAPWEVCAMCHGATGISATAKFPKLAGQKQDYLIRQFAHFRQGKRSNDGGQMEMISQEVAITDIEAITRYFATLQPPPAVSLAGEEKGACNQGQRIYLKGKAGVAACSECHSQPQSDAPWLDGQHAGYIEKQLEDFRSGERDSAGLPMKAVASALTDADSHAVAVYLAATAIRAGPALEPCQP